jgi:hypothetical protein
MAASVGAGMLLGGFLASLLALVRGLTPVERDQVLVAGSSWAGLMSVAVLVGELILR